jgi:MFS transporter, NNP family, nitrate/nitrite transporter
MGGLGGCGSLPSTSAVELALGVDAPDAGVYVAFIAFYLVFCLVTWAVFIRQRPGRLLGV